MSHDTEIPLPTSLSPTDPLFSAKTFIHAGYRNEHGITLRHYGGQFYAYQPHTGYVLTEDAGLRSCLYKFLPQFNKGESLKKITPSTRMVSDIVDALKGLTYLPTSTAAPFWIDTSPGRPIARNLVPCANGLLDISTRTLYPSTPLFFTVGALNFTYTADPPTPHRWLRLLHELWPEDAESQETLQEWIGYLLTANTHFQKILLLVGPPRSGKGTIGRVIQALLGKHRVCAPTLSNLSQQFGMAVLIDKAAAIISDARLSGRADTAIIAERLLSLSGEDPQSIPRKNLSDWNGSVPVRFTLMTNELPRIEDTSGALASRFVILVLKESFLGREDHQLFASLENELPAIFHWALDGWDRLAQRHAFLMPEASQRLQKSLEELGSPTRAFLTECVDLVSGSVVSKSDLFAAWQRWCQSHGREHAGTSAVFSRNLNAVLPHIDEERPRVNGLQERSWVGIALKRDIVVV